MHGSSEFAKAVCPAILASMLVLAALGSCGVKAEGGGFLIFENFESYYEGVRPPYFQLVEEGAGVMYQTVTDDYAFDGSKSLRLIGTSGLFGSVKIDFSNPRADMGLAAHMMAENFTFTKNSEGFDNVNIALGFSYSSSTEYYGSILFSETGNIIFDYGVDQSILMPYEAHRWYLCGLLLNYTTNQIGAFIDGRLMASAYLNIDLDLLGCIRISSGESGVAGYIDDLSLYAYSTPSPAVSTRADYPLFLIPAVIVAIGVPSLLFVRHLRSSMGMPRRALRIEEIMKAIGLGAPLLSFGLIITLNNRAFGEQHQMIMISLGSTILIVTVIIVAYMLSKWKTEV